MATVIYQLSHIYMVNHIDMNIFVIMLTFWQFDINQPKKRFSLACHQGGCSTRALTTRLVLLYFVQPSS